MRALLVLVVAAAGCYHPLNLDHCDLPCGARGACPSGLSCTAGLCLAAGETCARDAMPGSDAASDAPGDGIAGCSVFLPNACVDTSVMALSLPNGMLSTDNCTDVIQQPGGSKACLMSAHSVLVDSGVVVTVVGALPLVIAADTISISGTLSVASKNTVTVGTAVTGAGADLGCPTAASFPSSGGGAGGGFAANAPSSSLGGPGGSGVTGGGDTPSLRQSTSALLGGCPGDPAAANVHGGHGGGAVWLFATSGLTVSGVIEAGGAGGGGGGVAVGGGGGGAGGMIGLESSAIKVTSSAYIVANGGGGGGGGSSSATGNLGFDASTSGAPGGAGGGAMGGKGGFQDQPGGSGDNSTTGGGGGGGGGEGTIYTIGTVNTISSNVSPSPRTTLP